MKGNYFNRSAVLYDPVLKEILDWGDLGTAEVKRRAMRRRVPEFSFNQRHD